MSSVKFLKSETESDMHIYAQQFFFYYSVTKKENPRLLHVLGRTYAACANGIVAIFRAKTKEQAESKAEKIQSALLALKVSKKKE